MGLELEDSFPQTLLQAKDKSVETRNYVKLVRLGRRKIHVLKNELYIARSYGYKLLVVFLCSNIPTMNR